MKLPDFRSFVRQPTGWLVALLVVLLLLAFCDDGEAGEVSLELGGTLFNVEGGGVVQLDARWPAGIGNTQVAAGVFLIGESDYKGRVPLDTQAGVYMQLVDTLPGRFDWLEVGVGIAYQQKDEVVVNTPFRFDLSIGATFDNETWWLPDAIRHRHRSSAGSSPINSGWDMLMLEWNVGGKP